MCACAQLHTHAHTHTHVSWLKDLYIINWVKIQSTLDKTWHIFESTYNWVQYKSIKVYKSKSFCRDRLINTTIKLKSTLSLKWNILYKVGAYEPQRNYKQYSRFPANYNFTDIL